MCIQFRSYLRGARFIIRTDHKSLAWLHRFKDTEGMMARWLHTLQKCQFSIVHRAGQDHSNADGLSRVPIFPCGQCTRVDCPRVDTAVEVADQPFDAESETRRTLTSSPYSLERIGWLNLMTTCPNRPLRLGRSFISVPYSSRMPHASHCWNGSGLTFSPPGRRLRDYARKYDCYGITVITCR